uniref:ADNP homeobox 2b n=1 Tax=Lates calcarifer TaxID=8187 RepID=A0A4W6DVD0_LATCA
MYQVPVGSIEKIRKARKAVKNILSEIGLEDCQNLLKLCIWLFGSSCLRCIYFTFCFSLSIQWPYRSRSLCCNLCKYSSQNIYNFRSHVSRCHGYVQSYCALSSCSRCLFIGHPKVVKKHMLFFHSKHIQPPRDLPLPVHRGNERYQCRRCGFPNSSIFAMKKHIILKHLESLAEQYIGYRLHLQGTTSIKVYCCKVCKVNAGNLDQMLHHMLVEPSHYSVSTQVQSMIHENKNYTIKPTPNGNGVFVTFPSIAPKPQQPQMFNSKSLVLPSNVPLSSVPPEPIRLFSSHGSLLSHLIPTGNKVNGMPTYTFAPLQLAMPISQSTSTPLKAVEQTSNSLPQTKKWITCLLCNELFPSNVFDMHTEVAHQTKSPTSKSESVAARAAFLKKMPDKTVKCLTCKILLSEKSVFQHLLHGLNCLYCSALFFSIKQLAEHRKTAQPHKQGIGGILFPYFDVHTTAPKEVLGDTEVNLALVTNSLDLIFFKLQPSSQPEICPAPVKINSAYCPFCDEKFENKSKHLQHLKQKHFVAPTIHAILKTEAFKCIYCNGVYTGKVTQQAVMLHIQRCRCSPKQPHATRRREQEKMLPPPEPEVPSDPAVKLLLEPTPTERRCNEERRDFISKYFNLNPYATKAETDELCKRLGLTKAELAAHFSKKRSKCMKSLKRNSASILLGFNMTELRKLKHSLIVPEQQPAEQPPADTTEQMENSEDGPEPMDESGNEKVMNEVEQMQ